MKALVIYDSQFGNTEQIAKAISGALGDEAKAIRVGSVKPADLAPYALVIFGSPTQAGRMTAAMKSFLDSLTSEVLADKRYAAFDTRFKGIVKIFGYAAPRIESILKDKGGNTTAQPQGFIVKGTKGPLAEGELDRAAAWAKAVAAGVPTGQMKGDYEFKTKE